MIVRGPLSMLLPAAKVHALLMATSMAAGMVACMAWKRHSWPAVDEMALAMYLSFVVLCPLYWLGRLSAEGLVVAGHVVMLPAMALAMLHRRAENIVH